MRHITLPDFVLDDLRSIYPVFDLVKNGITITDKHSKILYVNPAFSDITGYLRNEAIDGNPGLLRSGYHNEAFYKGMWSKIIDQGFWEGVIWNRQKSGRIYPSLLTITQVKNTKGDVTNYLAIFSDITFLESESTERINLAYYDPLTKLPNRLALNEHFNRIISGLQRKHFDQAVHFDEKDQVAILFFDLNKFKSVNDTYGHVVGDKLLKQIADRLKELTRGIDNIGRFGGDEFVGIIPVMGSDSLIEKYCERICGIFSTEFNIDLKKIHSSACIGVSIYPYDGTEFDDLINKADKAMYFSKKNNKQYIFYKKLHHQ